MSTNKADDVDYVEEGISNEEADQTTTDAPAETTDKGCS